jgi:hypothetical protein
MDIEEKTDKTDPNTKPNIKPLKCVSKKNLEEMGCLNGSENFGL